MTEEELNRGLRDVMERTTPPPSMDSSSALKRGRTARRRRRLTWSGIAVVPLVAGIALAPQLLGSRDPGGQVGDLVAAGGTPSPHPSSETSEPAASTAPSKAPSARKSGDPWPEGQTDRTASAGPRVVRVTKLLEDLSSAVPERFTAPDLKDSDGEPLRNPQAQYASSDGEPDYWEYAATIPVEHDGKVGQLRVQSTTPNGKGAIEPCKLAKQFWGGSGSCKVVDAGGKKVGVVTTKGGGDFDQWASYRHDDGTVVILAQSRKFERQSKPPLTQPIFTSAQLAELVTSATFKLSE
ncbi:hypothetical protein HPO96_09385 [Kribbella sandramycini]|uniref:Uncharacterized protein n=1 Tax=Kribbella sandramycini TaxID=60450 RepID=A0A7Y4KZD5_9ACTN|nr:hypothetical protein [Kribbella sandramycini]MBB6569714.1 hypothetical protein [Kribbella sandramycini]NOL40456.1 hypothetical protein [Kribbella sandramycini]